MSTRVSIPRDLRDDLALYFIEKLGEMERYHFAAPGCVCGCQACNRIRDLLHGIQSAEEVSP